MKKENRLSRLGANSRRGNRPSGSFFSDLLSFKRTPGKIQLLSIHYWYKDGSEGDLNITSPHVYLSEDIERQYIYMKKYLQDAARDLGIVAFQAHICHILKDGAIHKTVTFDKIEVSTLTPIKTGRIA